MKLDTAAKYADPAFTGPVIGAIGVMLSDDWIVRTVAVIIGMAFGAMWRAGSLVGKGKSWPAIRSDLLVSLMIGGANAVLALTIAEWMDAGPLFSMSIGVLVGATGLHALPMIRDNLLETARKRLLDEGVSMLMPRPDDGIKDALDEYIQQDKTDERE